MAWLLAVLAIVACVWVGRRRSRLRDRYVSTRSEAHEAHLWFVTAVLEDPDAVKLLVARRVMSVEGVRLARESAGEYSEAWVRTISAKITSDRVVRRKLAELLSKRQGEDKHAMMRMLMGITEVVR